MGLSLGTVRFELTIPSARFFHIGLNYTVRATIGPQGSPQPTLHELPTSHFPLAVPMSASNQTVGPSTDNFSSIFNAALNEYQRLTKKSLDTHPFAAQLDTCQNPEAISVLFRTQAQALSKFREGDERLMAWLDPTIHILWTFSDTLGEGIGLVRNLVNLHMTFLDIQFSGIFTCEDHLHRDWRPSRSTFFLLFLTAHLNDVQLLGCEGCCGEP